MAKLKLVPLGSKIVVERIDPDGVTPGGIVLPDVAKEKPKRGMVKSVGSGKVLESGKRIEPQVKIDDQVLFAGYSGTEVEVDRQEFLIIDESDVLAVIA